MKLGAPGFLVPYRLAFAIYRDSLTEKSKGVVTRSYLNWQAEVRDAFTSHPAGCAQIMETNLCKKQFGDS